MISEDRLLAENMEQVRIALSDPDNRYFAWQRLGREPTQSDLIEQYILMGGSEKYREQHPVNPGESGT